MKLECSSLQALTNPIFIKLHLNRSLASNSNLSLIFRDFRHCHLYSLDLDACYQQAAAIEHEYYGIIEIGGSCNGLHCLYESESVHDIFLWNPSTKMLHKLPQPYDRLPPIVSMKVFYRLCRGIVYGFGYNPITDDYKVVRSSQFSDRDNNFDRKVKVYSLRTNSWRRIKDMPFHVSHCDRAGVLVNSVLHWIANCKKRPNTASYFIGSFDLRDEEYGVVPLPDFVGDKVHMNSMEFFMTIRVLGGQLCVICNFFTVRVEVWVMKDSWAKQFSIEHSSLVIEHFLCVRPICYSKNGKVILKTDYNALILYDPPRERARDLGSCGVPKAF